MRLQLALAAAMRWTSEARFASGAWGHHGGRAVAFSPMARMLTGTQGAIPSSHPSAHVMGMLRVSATMLIACRIVRLWSACGGPQRMINWRSKVRTRLRIPCRGGRSTAPTALGFLWKLVECIRRTLFRVRGDPTPAQKSLKLDLELDLTVESLWSDQSLLGLSKVHKRCHKIAYRVGRSGTLVRSHGRVSRGPSCVVYLGHRVGAPDCGVKRRGLNQALIGLLQLSKGRLDGLLRWPAVLAKEVLRA